MSHCKDGSCGIGHDNSSQGSCSHCGCSCGKSCKCRGTCTCGSAHDESEVCQKFLELADEAWGEVLKEKIKEIVRNSDPKINELAQIIAETNKQRWHQKMAAKKGCEDYKQKLKNLFRQ